MAIWGCPISISRFGNYWSKNCDIKLFSYAFDKESVPSVGQLNLILDDKLVPKVLTVNTKVTLQSYDQIGDDIAFLEGEGTRDLIYWRQVHEPFFAEVAKEIGQSFIPQDLIVTEYFKVLKIL